MFIKIMSKNNNIYKYYFCNKGYSFRNNERKERNVIMDVFNESYPHFLNVA